MPQRKLGRRNAAVPPEWCPRISEGGGGGGQGIRGGAGGGGAGGDDAVAFNDGVGEIWR